MSNINKEKRSNQSMWLAHVKAYRQSGLNRAEYCRQDDLPYHTLIFWSKKALKNARRNTCCMSARAEYRVIMSDQKICFFCYTVCNNKDKKHSSFFVNNQKLI